MVDTFRLEMRSPRFGHCAARILVKEDSRGGGQVRERALACNYD